MLKILWPKTRIKNVLYLVTINLSGYTISTLPPEGVFKWIDPKEFELNKYTRNSSKGCVLEVHFEYPKELQ